MDLALVTGLRYQACWPRKWAHKKRNINTKNIGIIQPKQRTFSATVGQKRVPIPVSGPVYVLPLIKGVAGILVERCSRFLNTTQP